MSIHPLIPSWPIAHKDLQLGILFHNLNDPHQGFFMDKSVELLNDIAFVEIQNFSVNYSVGNDKNVAAKLTELVSAYVRRHGNDAGVVSSLRAGIYTLQNSEAIFDQMRTQPSVRKWINTAAMRNRKVYMLVGKQTITDSNFSFEINSARAAELGLRLPVGAAVAGAVGIPVDVSGTALDVSTKARSSTVANLSRGLQVKEEMVWAIRYRELKYMRWPKNNLKNALLDNTDFWEFKGSGRSGTDEATEVLEVSLEEEQMLQVP